MLIFYPFFLAFLFKGKKTLDSSNPEEPKTIGFLFLPILSMSFSLVLSAVLGGKDSQTFFHTTTILSFFFSAGLIADACICLFRFYEKAALLAKEEKKV